MFPFSVTHHTLPVHDVQKIVTLKPVSPNFLRTMSGLNEHSMSTSPVSACGIWREGSPIPVMVLRGDCSQQRKVCVPTPGKSRPHLRGRPSLDSSGKRSPYRRSVTIQMKVWSSQLYRLKRKTEALRKKDDEIKERFEEVRRKAKRLLSDTELTEDNEDYVTPTKKQRLANLETERARDVKIKDVIHTNRLAESRTKLMTSPPPGNERQCMDNDSGAMTTNETCVSDNVPGVDNMSSHLLDAPSRRYRVAPKRHRSSSDVPSSAMENGEFLHPVPFPRTFLKNGKKYTNC